MRSLATIGYEGASVADFLDTLRSAEIELLVDVRAVAMSRRPGFAKSALAANLEGAGIGYLHLRKLGTPAEGRAAARAGDHATMRTVFATQLATDEAQAELATLAGLVESGRPVCIMCFEANPEHCHRTLVARALKELMPLEIVDLMPGADES